MKNWLKRLLIQYASHQVPISDYIILFALLKEQKTKAKSLRMHGWTIFCPISVYLNSYSKIMGGICGLWLSHIYLA